MVLCHKVSNPCSEQEADEFDECKYTGFYVDALKEIHGYCFGDIKECKKLKGVIHES